MRKIDEKGLTLVELLVAIMILGLIALAITAFLSSAIQAQASGNKKSALYREGLLTMERITDSIRRCTHLKIPNAHNPTRNMVALSGFVNDDNDYYFDDPLFPRIDEDVWRDMNNDNENGIAGKDDDGDGLTDEGFGDYNDDEDSAENEDLLDGQDNDGDGNIDEDTWADLNLDWSPGVKGMDDDGDGVIDEGHENDDDEDGQQDEDGHNEMIYWIPNGTTLREDHHISGENRILSERVTFFQAEYEAPEKILITLTLTGDDGENITFTEYAYPRNTLQKTGKRVR